MTPVARCAGCPYRGDAVGCTGPVDSPYAIVGEAPGAQELIARRPFVGPSGRLLWATLAAADAPPPEAWYVTNALRCRPVGDSPARAALEACRPRLLAELMGAQRQVVLALGTSALRAVTGDHQQVITRARGRAVRLPSGAWLVPTWHPAAVLRQGGLKASVYNQFVRDLRLAARIARGEPPEPPPEPEVREVTTPEDVADAIRALRAAPVVFADIETYGLNPREDRIRCLGAATGLGRVWVFPEEVIYGGLLAPLFAPGGPRFVWHNGKFDVSFLRAAGLEARLDEDTMLLHYALDEAPGTHSLKLRAMEERGLHDYEVPVKRAAREVRARQREAARRARVPLTEGVLGTGYGEVPASVLYPYLAWDVDNTAYLYTCYRPRVERSPNLRWLYEELLLPAARFLQRVEARGIYVDQEALSRLRAQLEPQRKAARETVLREAARAWDPERYAQETHARTVPKALNIDSPRQLGWLLYERLRYLPPPGYGPNTRKETLRHLPRTPLIEALLAYRDCSKKLATYVDGIQSRIEADGRLHATFNVTGTETGRLSATGTQNIPREDEVRGVFGAPPGRVLVEVDMAGAELRVLAALSGDRYLTQVFREGRDLHSEMAQAVYGPQFTAEQRTHAKRLNFGIVYGITAHGLSKQLDITEDQAQALIDAWLARCPEAAAFLRACRAVPRTGGYLETPFGRRRRFSRLIVERTLHDVENEAANFAIQSVSSDIVLLAALELDAPLEQEDEALIVNIVHDSILVEVPDDPARVARVVQRVREAFEAVPRRELGDAVPFVAEAKVGRNWGALQPYGAALVVAA